MRKSGTDMAFPYMLRRRRIFSLCRLAPVSPRLLRTAEAHGEEKTGMVQRSKFNWRAGGRPAGPLPVAPVFRMSRLRCWQPRASFHFFAGKNVW